MQIAARQHGVIASYQLRSTGTRSAIRHELDGTGRWDQLETGLYMARASPASPKANLMAAVLSSGPGAAAARSSAAALWTLPGFEIEPAHVVRPKSTNSTTRRGSYSRHESRRLPGDDITVVDGIPTTAPPRTLIDLGERMFAGRLERLLDRAWSLGLVSHQSVLECCDRLGGRGRPAVPILRKLVEDRGSKFVPPASNLESRLNQLLKGAGLGVVRRQVAVGGVTWLGRVDFLHPCGLVIEVQSEGFHASLSDVKADEARFAAMRDAGFDVVAVWDREIWHQPERALDSIRLALNRRRSTRA